MAKKHKNGVSEAYLDQIFSVYIRLSNSDDEGYVTCCNCGKRMYWKESTNGHFIKRRHRTLRWDERNCAPECAPCNTADVNLGFAEYLVEKYGPKIWRILNTQKNLREKITPQERKIMADNYKHKIKQLRKEKGL